jgi:drug/metabolite transporter (DMT)-like permease
MIELSVKTIGEIEILIGTFLFAVSYILRKYFSNMSMGPYGVNAVVCTCGFVVTALASRHLKRIIKPKEAVTKQSSFILRIPWINSKFEYDCELLCYGALFAISKFIGMICCQLGLNTVSTGKVAFLTSLYIIFTPILQIIMERNFTKLDKVVWICALSSVVGSFLITCGSGDINSVGFGELITIFGAIWWAIYIVAVDFGCQRVCSIDLVYMGMLQTSVISFIAALIMEGNFLLSLNTGGRIAWISLASCGLVESTAFILDTVAQADVAAHRAALIMGLDGPLTVLLALVAFNERLTIIELVGCGIMLVATSAASVHGAMGDSHNGVDVADRELLPDCSERREMLPTVVVSSSSSSSLGFSNPGGLRARTGSDIQMPSKV